MALRQKVESEVGPLQNDGQHQQRQVALPAFPNLAPLITPLLTEKETQQTQQHNPVQHPLEEDVVRHKGQLVKQVDHRSDDKHAETGHAARLKN